MALRRRSTCRRWQTCPVSRTECDLSPLRRPAPVIDRAAQQRRAVGRGRETSYIHDVRFRALPWGLAALVVCAAAARAEAPAPDKDLAAQRAREGEELGNAKDFVGALKKFREAVDLDPDMPAYACNVGMANYALNHYPRAHLWLTRCRNANGGSFGSSGVEQVFHFIENDLRTHDYTPISIRTSPPGARVQVSYYDSEGSSRAPITMYVAFGRYQITIESDGYKTIHDQLVATGHSTIAKRYAMEREEPTTSSSGVGAGAGAAPLPGAGDPGGAVDLRPDDGGPRSDTGTHHRAIDWWLMGAGGVLLVGAGVTEGIALHFYLSGQGKQNDPNYRADYYNKNITWQERTIALGAAGAVVGLVGAYLWYRDGHRAPVTVAAAPTHQGAAVLFTWTH